jgi:dTDP-4-dehydrorhamnose reductase
MRIIIGNGKLAQQLKKPYDVVLSHKDIEIRDEPLKLVKVLREAREKAPVDIDNIVDSLYVEVINTAALINLEYCEHNKEECFAVNTLGALHVAQACDALGWKLVHISSGCVFDGMGTGKEYNETDEPTPASYYAYSKAEADRLILDAKFDIPILILRPRQLVSAIPYKTNLLTKFLGVPQPARFIESANSITCIENFCDMVDHLLKVCATGIFNCANEGTISPYEIAVKLTKLNPDLNPQPIDYQKYLNSIEVKRVNTVLDISKLKATGYHPRTAHAVIDWCVENYGKQS